MTTPAIRLRGIRESIPPGYVIGRTNPGVGDVHLIAIGDLTNAAAVKAVAIPNSTTNIVRFYYSLPQVSPAVLPGAEYFAVAMVGDETFPAGFVGSVGGAEVAPTGTVTIATFYKNGVSFGTAQIAASATVATFTAAASVSFNAGDILSAKASAGAVADATLSGVFFTIIGTRT